LGFGVGQSTLQAFTFATSTGNATSSLQVGKSAQNKGSCLALFDAAGSSVYAYIPAGATTFTISSVSCK